MKKLLIGLIAAIALTSAYSAEGDLRDIKMGLGATQYQIFTPFPAPGTQCIRYMDGANGTTAGKTVGCWKIGDGLTITGGDTVNAAGSPGPQGAQGIQGVQGPQGSTGAAGTTSYNGLTDVPSTFAPSLHTHTVSQITDFPAAPQRVRVTTAADGTYTWTFPAAYGGGVIPVVTALPEADGAMSVTAISNTSVTVKLIRLTNVTVLGVNVLAAGTSAATVIHLTARAP